MIELASPNQKIWTVDQLAQTNCPKQNPIVENARMLYCNNLQYAVQSRIPSKHGKDGGISLHRKQTTDSRPSV